MIKKKKKEKQNVRTVRDIRDVRIVHDRSYYEDSAVSSLERTIKKFFEKGYLPAGTIFDEERWSWSQVFIKGEAKELEIKHFSPAEAWEEYLEKKYAEGWTPAGSFKAFGNQHYQILIR